MTLLFILYGVFLVVIMAVLSACRRLDTATKKTDEAAREYEVARDRLEFLCVCVESAARVEALEQERADRALDEDEEPRPRPWKH